MCTNADWQKVAEFDYCLISRHLELDYDRQGHFKGGARNQAVDHFLNCFRLEEDAGTLLASLTMHLSELAWQKRIQQLPDDRWI
jgi:hypothetical protein